MRQMENTMRRVERLEIKGIKEDIKGINESATKAFKAVWDKFEDHQQEIDTALQTAQDQTAAFENLKQFITRLQTDIQQHIDKTETLFKQYAENEQQKGATFEAMLERLEALELAQQRQSTNFALLAADVHKRLAALEYGGGHPENLDLARQRGQAVSDYVDNEIDRQTVKELYRL